MIAAKSKLKVRRVVKEDETRDETFEQLNPEENDSIGRYSPRSLNLKELDEKNHQGPQFHRVCRNFYTNVLSKSKFTP